MTFLILPPLYALALLGSLFWSIYRWKARGQGSLSVAVFLGLVVAYLIGFANVVNDPWWDDNGSPTLIRPDQMWAWAWFLASYIQIYTVPLALLCRAAFVSVLPISALHRRRVRRVFVFANDHRA